MHLAMKSTVQDIIILGICKVTLGPKHLSLANSNAELCYVNQSDAGIWHASDSSRV